MKTLKTTLTLALSLAVVAGCDDDDDFTGVENDMVGDFQATQVEFQSQADPNVTADPIADGGSFDLTLREDGTFESNFRDGNGVDFTNQGTFTVRGDQVDFDDDFFLDDDELTGRSFDVTRTSGTESNLTLEGDAQFDFNLDHQMEDARVNVLLREDLGV